MALSMEEQRMLAEIESQLAREDPRLAARMARGTCADRRRRRILAPIAVLTVLVLTLASTLAAVVSAVSAILQ